MKQGEGRRRFRCALEVAGLGPGCLRYFEATALRESKFQPRAHNATADEKAASGRAYDNLPESLKAAIGYGRDQWAQGSKGLVQFLGPYVAVGSGKLRFPKRLVDPDMAYTPGVNIAAALSFARGVMNRSAFTGTWAGLAVAWGGGNISVPERLERARVLLEKYGARLGYTSGWATEPVDPLPSYSPEQLASLATSMQQRYLSCEAAPS